MSKKLTIAMFLCLLLAGCAGREEPVPDLDDDEMVCTYLDVLQNKAMLFSVWDDDYRYLTDYVERDSSQFAMEELLITAIDLDHDGITELVLQYPNWDKEVLHFHDNTVYAHNFGVRSMNQLKIDGTSGWSNSAWENGIGSYVFDGDQCEFIRVAYSDHRNEVCFINGVAATGEEIDAFYRRQSRLDDVTWYPFTEETLGLLF